MFEREIKFIYDFNLNRIKKSGSYLTFEQLLSLEIHPAILKYISAEIDFLIFEDRQKLLNDSVFDYSGEKVNNYFNLIDAEIKKSKKLSIEYIDKLLLHAISFSVNYLVRPRWTLARFLFDNNESKSKAEIKQILQYIYFYNYLTDTLVSYLDKKKLLEVDKSDVEELIIKIDDFAIESYLVNIIGTAVSSMSDFFNIGSVQQNQVHVNAIKLFLEEKNLDEHVKKLESAFVNDEKAKHSTSDIIKILSSRELAFNLKAMETEQIDEEALEEKEAFEFEAVDDEISDTQDDMTVSAIENKSEPITDEENVSLAEDDISDNNQSIPSIENYEEEDISNAVSNETIFDTETETGGEESEFEDFKDSVASSLVGDEDNVDIQNQHDSESMADENTDIEDKFVFEKSLSDEESNIHEEAIESESEVEGINSIDTQETPDFEDQDNSPENLGADSNDLNEEDLEDETVLEEVEAQENGLQLHENLPVGEELNISEDEIEFEEVDAEMENEESNSYTDSEEEAVNLDNKVDSLEEPESEILEEGVEDFSDEEFSKDNGIEIQEELSIEEIEENISPGDGDDFIKSERVEEHSQEDESSELLKEIPIDGDSGFDENDQTELFQGPESEIIGEDSVELSENSNSTEKVDNQEIIADENHAEPALKIEIADLLENKKMSIILSEIFDYDMDDFVNAIENISECDNEEDALIELEKIYKTNGVKTSSREAKLFNSIISKYFKKIQ